MQCRTSFKIDAVLVSELEDVLTDVACHLLPSSVFGDKCNIHSAKEI